MVSGKPYISVNSATTKAENMPSVRQSCRLRGLKKLAANRIKKAELIATRTHSP